MKDFFKEKRQLIRTLVFLFADSLAVILSVLLAFLVRFEAQIPSRYLLNIEGIIFLALLITIPVIYFSKLYSFAWAYVSTEELVSLVRATGLSFLLLTASFFVLRDHPIFSGFPRSTLFITYFFIFVLCGGVRFAKRVYLQVFSQGDSKEKEKTLIIGAGDAGEQILRSILKFKSSPYFPVGFIDDNPTKQGVLIHGIKVLGRIENIDQVAKDLTAETLIIALPSAGSRVIAQAVENGRKAGIKKIKIIPPMTEIMGGQGGQVGLKNLRAVEAEDLLGRDPVTPDFKLIEGFIANKTILITGGAGSIGSELCRQVAKFNPSLLLVLDQDETGVFNISGELKEKFPKLNFVSLVADIQDESKISRIFEKYRPQTVFHAAAYKHVPLMEDQPEEAVKNNVFGTKNVVNNCLKCGAEKFVFISTDKAVNPSSVMGATKRIGEMICQAANGETKFVSVRFGNVLDSRGSVIPIFREQIKRGGPVEVTHPDMKRYFMTTPEACLLVMQAGAMGKGGEVFVLDMGKPVKIIDLAREMIKLSGLQPDKDIPIVFTGIRPGEKLFEEMLTAEEGTVATQNQKIFMAKLSGPDKDGLRAGLEKLKESAYNEEDKKIIKGLIKEIVPGYKTN